MLIYIKTADNKKTKERNRENRLDHKLQMNHRDKQKNLLRRWLSSRDILIVCNRFSLFGNNM